MSNEADLQMLLLDAAAVLPSTPGVTYTIEEKEDGRYALMIRDVRLGAVGRVTLRRVGNTVRATTEVAGDLDDSQTRARHDLLAPIASSVLKHLGAEVDELPFSPLGTRREGGKDIAAQQVPCPRCGAIVAFLIHADDARTVGGLEDYARLLHSETVRLNVPTWVLGPALGDGPIRERPADMLKVWPDRGLVKRQRPADLDVEVGPLVRGHCR